jgi:outer membrane protein TolC
MNEKAKAQQMEEKDLIKLYMDLTGVCESDARNVFMYVCPCETAAPETRGGIVLNPAPEAEPDEKGGSGGGSGRALALAALAWLWLGGAAAFAASSPPATTNSFLMRPLSLADAVDLALRQNPAILRAQKDLEATEGVTIQTRAIAVPKLNVAGSYNAVQRADVDIISIPGMGGFSFGNDQNWESQVRVMQSLYEGGRIVSSFRVARLQKAQSMSNYETAVADTVLGVEVGYYDVLLAEQQIRVQEASVNLLSNEVVDTTRRFDAGTLPRFNVLRAEVELANERPKLIQARNNLRIGKNNLSNLLGFNVPKETREDIPLTLSGKLEAEPYKLDLPRAVALALERRSELESLQKAEELRKEDIVTAKAGFLPSLQAYAGYDAHNSMLSQDLGYEDHGWIAGVQMSWNLFDGQRTRGRVQEARALYQRAGIELDDARRRIELEVRTAYSGFIEADEVLKSQVKVLEWAEEALRLAKARNDAGTGTQLDVLSAQTALTEARTTQVQALHDFAVARARLERAVGMNVPGGAGKG